MRRRHGAPTQLRGAVIAWRASQGKGREGVLTPPPGHPSRGVRCAWGFSGVPTCSGAQTAVFVHIPVLIVTQH